MLGAWHHRVTDVARGKRGRRQRRCNQHPAAQEEAGDAFAARAVNDRHTPLVRMEPAATRAPSPSDGRSMLERTNPILINSNHNNESYSTYWGALPVHCFAEADKRAEWRHGQVSTGVQLDPILEDAGGV